MIRSCRWSLLTLCFLLSLVGGTTLHAQVTNNFVETGGTFTTNGQYYQRAFTLTKTQKLVLRMTSDYPADAAVVTPAQLANFTRNLPFTGLVTLDNVSGTKSVTLQPGTYHLAVRSQVEGTNIYQVELDRAVALLADPGFTYGFVDNYLQNTVSVGPFGGKGWQAFTVQEGFRYFLEGCNTGLQTYVIPSDKLMDFRASTFFEYTTTYSGTGNSFPGLDEIVLPPGDYYVAFRNPTGIPKPVTYTLERWRMVPRDLALDIIGSARWKALEKNKVEIKVAKIKYHGASGKSGQLRLRLRATKRVYNGGKLSGHVLATHALKPLSAGKFYSKVKAKVKLKLPPAGKYYTVLVLEEKTSTGWVVRDHVTFTKQIRW